MAKQEGSEDLIFPMHLDIDVSHFQKEWTAKEPALQKILDAKPLTAKINIDGDALIKVLGEMSKMTGSGVAKTRKEVEALEGSLQAIKNEMIGMTGQAFGLPVADNKKEIESLIQKSRELKGEIISVSNAALPLKDILSIGGKNPTGLNLKTMRDELQRFINAEKEGSAEAVIANEKLLAVKDRIRNMYGKQESALKATSEEKKVNETIAAYKKLESELDKINARIRARASVQAGQVIPTTSVSVSAMGTKDEAAIYSEISAAMDRYRSSLSAVNQEKLKATPVESARKEIDLNNQNLSIQDKINTNLSRQTQLWATYDQILKKPEATLSQINAKINQISTMKSKLNMDDKQIKEADSLISNLQTKLASLKVPSGALSAQFSALNKQWNSLSLNDRTGTKGQALIAQYQKLTTAAGQAAGTIKNAAKVQDSANRATDNAVKSLNNQNAAYKSQRGLLNGLPQMVNSYISVLGAYRLASNIVKTTAEFEMQRVALAAIIQDKPKADKLFSQMIELGLQSPFQIKELITYTKQLAAYRIETDQLYDTTKRLADISAGLGVDMSRLILAYGQVRAASVLRGQELRQFTEAGIPLVQLLADKFTILNGKATTTGEVFDLMRKRAIPFEMVKQIFEDMTDAGGTFYNMQQIQSQTLKGSMSNLRDAFDKMFMQMGNSQMGMLKGGINAIKDFANNWEAVLDVIGSGVVVFGAYKLAIALNTAAMGKNNAMMISSIQSQNAKDAAMLRTQSRYMALIPMEQARVRIGREISDVQMAELLTSGKLTEANALRLVYLGKTNAAQELAMISTGKITAAEIELARARRLTNVQSIQYSTALNGLIASQGGVKITSDQLSDSTMQQYRTRALLLAQSGKLDKAQAATLVKIGLVTNAEIAGAAATVAYSGRWAGFMRVAALAGSALKGLAASIWATTKAMLFNPYTAVIVAISAIIGIWSKAAAQNKKYSDQLDASSKATKEYANEMKDAYEKIRETVEKGVATGADEKAITSARAALQQIIEKNEALKPLVEARLEKLTTEASKLAEIRDIWEEIKTATANGGKYTPSMTAAQKGTGSKWYTGGTWTNEDVVDNATDLSNAIDKISVKMTKMSTVQALYTSDLKKQLETANTGLKDGSLSLDEYSKALSGIYSKAAENKNALKPGADKDAWDGLMSSIMSAQFSIGIFKDDSKKLITFLDNSIRDVDKLILDRSKSGLGVSKKQLDQLHIDLATAKDMYFSAFSEIDKKGQFLLNNVINKAYRIPYKDNGGTKTNTDAEYYNSLLKKYKLTAIPEQETDASKNNADEDKLYEENQENLKSNTELLKKYTNQVNAKNLANKDAIPGLKELVRQETILNKLYGGGEEKPAAQKTDPRIAALSGQMKLVEEAYKKYNELRKQMGDEAAKAEVTKLYGGQNKAIDIKGVPELKSGLALAFDEKSMDAAYSTTIAGFKKLGTDAADEGRNAFLRQADTSFDAISMIIKTNLDVLADQIEQTQRANDFYEKMFSLTGSKEAAEKLTKAMGMTVGDMRTGIQTALSKSMQIDYGKEKGVVDYGLGVDMTDVNAVQTAINKMPEDTRKSAQKMLDAMVDYEKKQLEEIYSGLDDFMTSEQKKVKIVAETEKKIQEIRNNPNLSPEQKTTYEQAATTKGTGEIAKIGLDDLQKTDRYIKAFEDLGRVGGATLDSLYADLDKIRRELGQTPETLKTIGELMKKITDQKEQANPFEAWNVALAEYKQALLDVQLYSVQPLSPEYEAAQNDLISASDKLQESVAGIGDAFNSVINPIKKIVSLAGDLAETFGITFSDDTNKFIEDFNKGFELMGTAFEVVNSLMALNTMLTAANITVKGGEILVNGVATTSFWALAASIWASLAPLLALLAPFIAIAAAIGLAAAAINYFSNKKSNDRIKELNDLIEDTEEKINNLADAEGRLVGTDYTKNINAQIEATKKLIAYEKEKIAIEEAKAHDNNLWTNRDEDAIEESETAIEGYYDDIVQLQEDFMQEMTGYSNVADAATAFADAWYDAYLSTEDTFDALSEKFDEMIDEMVVKSILAKVVEARLAPLFQMITDAYSTTGPGGESMTAGELTSIQSYMGGLAGTIDSELSAWMSTLSSAGFDTSSSDSDLTGISASVSSMSEDTANTLGGYLNSNLLQLVQQTGIQQQVLAIMEKNENGTTLANLYTLQGQALTALNGIKSDTALMVISLAGLYKNQSDSMINGGQKAMNVRLI